MARTFGCLAVSLVACLTFGLSSASAAPRCQASDLRLAYSDGTFNLSQATDASTASFGSSPFYAVFIDLDAQT